MHAKMSLWSQLHNKDSFFLLSGPCAVEGEDICMRIAEEVKTITTRLGIPYVFKASYKKANRSSIKSFTGIGDEKALRILEKVKTELELPITTDIHTEAEAHWAAEVADILQIPAFLCRQTDLLVAAAKTGKIVNIKKGQFMSPESMLFAANKVKDSQNEQVLLTERGTTFGYGDLIIDFRGLPAMKDLVRVPVVMDCTHSLQQPNQTSGVTGGRPEMIATVVNAALAVGADGLFIETHPDPSAAMSDGANMLSLHKLEEILKKGKDIYRALHL